VVYLVTTLLREFSTECAGEKKFENRSIFGDDTDKSSLLTFLGHCICTPVSGHWTPVVGPSCNFPKVIGPSN